MGSQSFRHRRSRNLLAEGIQVKLIRLEDFQQSLKTMSLAEEGARHTQKKVNCVSCGNLQELARQIFESADYSDEGWGCEKLSGW